MSSAITENVADQTRRVHYANNFAVPRVEALSPHFPQEISLPAPGFFIGPGDCAGWANDFDSCNLHLDKDVSAVVP